MSKSKKVKEEKVIVVDSDAKADEKTEQKTFALRDLALAVAVVIVVAGILFGIRYISSINGNTPEPTPIPSPEPAPTPTPEPEPTPTPTTPYIDGPESAAVGGLVVLTLHNAEVASWSVIPKVESYTDTNQSVFIFASGEKESYTVFVSTIQDGQPYAITRTVTIGDGDTDNKDGGKQDAEPVELGDWVDKNLPADGEKDYKAVAEVFAKTVEKINSGALATDAAIWGYANGRLRAACTPKVWDGFLEGLTEKIKADGIESVSELKEAFDSIAAKIKSKCLSAPVSALASPVRVVNCPTGNCPRY